MSLKPFLKEPITWGPYAKQTMASHGNKFLMSSYNKESILLGAYFGWIAILMHKHMHEVSNQQQNVAITQFMGRRREMWCLGVNWAISASNQKRCVIAMVCKIVTDCLMAAKTGNQFTTVLERGRFIVVLIWNQNCPISDGRQVFTLPWGRPQDDFIDIPARTYVWISSQLRFTRN